MTTVDALNKGYKKIQDNFAKIIKVSYYTQSYDDVYDEAQFLTLSGAIWVSGIFLPINKLSGTKDYILQEQGRLQDDDQKLFVSGNIDLGASGAPIKIQAGSPESNTEAYTPVDIGVHEWTAQGTSIFKRAIVRKIPGGSLIGEIGDGC